MKYILLPVIAILLSLAIGFGINSYFQSHTKSTASEPLQSPPALDERVFTKDGSLGIENTSRDDAVDEETQAPTYSFNEEPNQITLPEDASNSLPENEPDEEVVFEPGAEVLQAIASQEAQASDALKKARLAISATNITPPESSTSNDINAATGAPEHDNLKLQLVDGYVVLPEPGALEVAQAVEPASLKHDVEETAGTEIAGSPETQEVEEPKLPDAQVDYYRGLRSYYFDDVQSQEQAFEIDSSKLFAGVAFNKPIAQDWLLEGDIRANYEWRHLYTDGDNEAGPSLALKELLLRKELLFDSPYWSMLLGRTRLSSERGWLIEDEMDVLQFSYDSTLLDINLGHARWLWDGLVGTGIDRFNDEQRLETSGTSLLFANAQYQWAKGHYVQAEYLYENFDNPRDVPQNEVRRNNVINRHSELHWLKFSAFGNDIGKVSEQKYWLDVAVASGDKKELRLENGFVAGLDDGDINQKWGIQAGFLHKNHVRGFGVGITAAYSPKQDDGPNFSQPVTASNKTQIFGQLNRRYYGELLAPRLENLAIISMHGGWQIDESLWLQMSLHQYRQHTPDRQSFHSRIGIPVNGKSKQIGSNFEVVFGGQISPNSKLELLASVFWAGAAFDDSATRKRSHRVQLQWRGWW
ncbi:MAG: alginate export family protein [Aestuariibacter sp.]